MLDVNVRLACFLWFTSITKGRVNYTRSGGSLLATSYWHIRRRTTIMSICTSSKTLVMIKQTEMTELQQRSQTISFSKKFTSSKSKDLSGSWRWVFRHTFISAVVALKLAFALNIIVAFALNVFTFIVGFALNVVFILNVVVALIVAFASLCSQHVHSHCGLCS